MLTTERESDYWAGRDSSIYDARTQIATYDSNQGICMGDSGGPLVLKSNLVQYGVCSYVLTRKYRLLFKVRYYRRSIGKNLIVIVT